MGMDACIAKDTDDANSKPSTNSILESLNNGGNGIEESNTLMEMLTRIDIDLAYSSEKLTNLDVYMAIVSLGESQLEELSKDVEIEKALMFDLSLCYLESEINALQRFLNVIQGEVSAAHKTLLLFEQRKERFTAFEGKLHVYDCSLRHLLEQLAGLERQLAIMRGAPYSQQNPFVYEDVTIETSDPNFQPATHHRLVLQMLDKSLSGQLDLENLLQHAKEHEEELKSKLLTTNEVVLDMEAFTEVALEKLLEAEHSSEVYMGIAKDFLTRFQILQFNTHCSAQRESELKSKLHEKETSLIEIELKSAKEKERLEEKVKKLEEILSVSESKLLEANEELSLMDNTAESLRNHAQSVETKVNTLTEENIELKEELAFLKDGDDNVEKISMLDKQVRDLEFQVQSAKASSEASLEQQNMLYTAIWDMETLIEELRSKVSRGESRADSAEKQCLSLAETNIKLNNEIRFLKNEKEELEGSLKVANETRVARVKDVYSGAKIVTELVVELASERERIQRQISALARENKILLEELPKMRKMVVKSKQNSNESNVNGSVTLVDDPTNTSVTRALQTITIIKDDSVTPTATTASNQVDNTGNQNIAESASASASASSSSTPDITAENKITNHETTNKKIITGRVSKKYYTFAAIVILLLSVLAVNINWQDLPSLVPQQYLGL